MLRVRVAVAAADGVPADDTANTNILRASDLGFSNNLHAGCLDFGPSQPYIARRAQLTAVVLMGDSNCLNWRHTAQAPNSNHACQTAFRYLLEVVLTCGQLSAGGSDLCNAYGWPASLPPPGSRLNFESSRGTIMICANRPPEAGKWFSFGPLVR